MSITCKHDEHPRSLRLWVPSVLCTPARLTAGYKDFPICQAMGTHNLTAKQQVIQKKHLVSHH